MITFYLVNLGGFVAALYSSQAASSVQPEVEGFFGGLFLLLSITGLLTILQLIRLRQAWFESVAAMNQIKEYYRRTSRRSSWSRPCAGADPITRRSSTSRGASPLCWRCR